jgi:hypothetical protein
MNAPAISNSLLRLDGTKGEPPPPFERPNDKMDFFVLELGEHRDVDSWCACTAKILQRHAVILRRQSQSGAKANMFVGYGGWPHVLRLEASFLRQLSEADVSLECYYDQVP